MSHPSGLLAWPTLVLGPHYPSLATFRCLACFTPHVTTLPLPPLSLDPALFLSFFISLNTSLQVPVCLSLFFNISLRSHQQTGSQPSPRGNFTLMVRQSSLGCQSKILWIKGLKNHRRLFLTVLVAGVQDQGAADSVSDQAPYLLPASSPPLGSPFIRVLIPLMGLPGWLSVKYSPASAGKAGGSGLILSWEDPL